MKRNKTKLLKHESYQNMTPIYLGVENLGMYKVKQIFLSIKENISFVKDFIKLDRIEFFRYFIQ